MCSVSEISLSGSMDTRVSFFRSSLMLCKFCDVVVVGEEFIDWWVCPRICRTTHDLDVEVSASGFTRGMQQSLEEEVSGEEW